MTHETPTDLPVQELLDSASEVRQRGKGHVDVHFKYTCENCGTRQTLAEPNTLFEYGECEECGHHTRITKGGYTVILKMGGTAPNLLRVLGLDDRGEELGNG